MTECARACAYVPPHAASEESLGSEEVRQNPLGESSAPDFPARIPGLPADFPRSRRRGPRSERERRAEAAAGDLGAGLGAGSHRAACEGLIFNRTALAQKNRGRPAETDSVLVVRDRSALKVADPASRAGKYKHTVFKVGQARTHVSARTQGSMHTRKHAQHL